MSPDRAAPLLDPVNAPAPSSGGWTTAASAGWLELALPLWHRRWWLLAATVVTAAAAVGLSLAQTVRFTGQASFVVQPVLKPSQGTVSSALPGLVGLVGAGASPVDLYVSIMRSQAINDRIIERFSLLRVWDYRWRAQAQARLARRVSFNIGRRDGVVVVTVEDESAARAASMANEYVEELRTTLRGFALEEARQRRQFYEAQLARARAALDDAQKKLQTSGYDRAALRAEPRAAAEGYGRMQAEVAAAEVQLAALQRVRSDASAEVQQQLAELAARRRQLALLERPKDDGAGTFVARVREFRYAETLADSIARQAEAARVDEAADALPLQMLDRARAPEWPSSPQPPLWLVLGALLGLAGSSAWVLLRHRIALARLDPAYIERVALIRSLLTRRRR